MDNIHLVYTSKTWTEHLNLNSSCEKLNITQRKIRLFHKTVEAKFTHTSLPLKFEDKMTVELWVIELFTLLCKVCSGVILSNRISLKIAVLVKYA